MENYVLENDIKVFCVTAASFPAGVMDAHQKLHTLVPFTSGRKYFGLSRPENGQIVYMTATEEAYDGEGAILGCKTLVIKKGNYVAATIHNYMQDTQAIGNTFQQQIAQPGIDPEGYCVEWYLSDKDVMCLVRLESNNN